MRGLLAAVTTVAVLAALSAGPLAEAAAPAGGDSDVARTGRTGVDYAMPAGPHVPAPKRILREEPGFPDDEFTFTFDSPEHPWSADDLDTLAEWTDPDSPYLSALLEVTGAPPRDITINIRRDPGLGNPGQYRTGLMTLRALYLDVFLHEMSHAVHDHWVLHNQVWEEGLARATESQALWLLEQRGITSDDGDPHYDYPYDRYHDLTNRPDLGVQQGLIWGYGNRAMALLRYENAGYAFGKALIEDPDFVRRLNAYLFQQPNGWVPESDLVAMAAAAKPTLEGVAFAEWFEEQGILDSDPPKGCRLFQRINQWTVDFFCRAANGVETPQAGALVRYRLYAANGDLLSEAETATSPLGWASFSPALGGYTGRVSVVASADSPGGPVTSTFHRQAPSERGVFGVVTNADRGTVTLTSPDDAFPPQAVEVVDGAFAVDSLGSYRGAVRLTYDGPAGRASRLITKAASPYGVSLTAVDVTAPETVIASGPKHRGFALTRSATFTYSTSEPPASFRCALNGRLVACDDEPLTLRRLAAATHRFAVASSDRAGNQDPTPAVRRWTVPVNDTRLRHHGSWTQRSGRSYYQRTCSQTSERGAKLSRRVSGVRRIVLVASQGPGHGTVRVSLDGRVLERVNLDRAQSSSRKVFAIARFARPRDGRLQVVVASSGKRVRIEGLGIETR